MSEVLTPEEMELAAGVEDPNRNDYIVIDWDKDEPEKWRWLVYAGNNQITHKSKVAYTRRWSARRAAARENPGVRVIDRTKPNRPSIPR